MVHATMKLGNVTSSLSLPLQMLGLALRLMEAGRHVAGSMFWMTAAPSYPDYDGFTVYLPPAPSAVPFATDTALIGSTEAAGPGAAALSSQCAEEPAGAGSATPQPRRRLGAGLGRLASTLLAGLGLGQPTAAAAVAPVSTSGPSSQAGTGQAQEAHSHGRTVRAILDHAARVRRLNSKQRQADTAPA